MDKKYTSIEEAFENCRFEDCLRQIDQLLKKVDKPDAKKKNQLTEKEMMGIHIFRAGSLAAVGDVHTANNLMQTYFHKPPITEEASFLFLQVCSMAMDRRLKQFTEEIQEHKDKLKIDISRFVLLARKFSVLSRTFLKLYMTEKKSENALAQIYLEYLQQIDGQGLIVFARDRTLVECKQLNLKMVTMFLNKFLTTFKAESEMNALETGRQKKLERSIADLLLKISIHEGNSSRARSLYGEWFMSLRENAFTYLRSIKNMSEEKEANEEFWVKENLSLFRRNLDLDLYHPIYDYSLEFLTQFLIIKTISPTSLKEPKSIDLQNLYTFAVDPLQQLQNYYDSLFTEYLEGKKQSETNLKKDFYRISVKNVLLLLLNMSTMSKHSQVAQEVLLEYKDQCGRTLTFSDEIRAFISQGQLFPAQFIEEKFKVANQKWNKPEDKLIWFINLERLFHKISEKQCLNEWKKLVAIYEENVNEVEKLRPLEKGERYMSDEILTIAADSIRHFTETQELSEKELEQIFFFILNVLENSIARSPYNHDLKIRAMYFQNKLGYYEQILKTLETMDIKAVQFDTLGFLYLRQIINYSLFEVNEGLLTRMVRSYQQNFRESSEYAFKALKAASFNECEENLCYNSHMNKSYNFCILLYVLYLKNRGKPDATFYLKEIAERIDDKAGLTFNCDFNVMRNVIYPQDQYVDFFGILNSPVLLKTDCLIKEAFESIVEKKEHKEILEKLGEIKKKWEVKEVYDFSGFSFFERELEYKSKGQLHHQKQNALSLHLYQQIIQIKIQAIEFSARLEEGGNFVEKADLLLAKIESVHGFVTSQSWRVQTKLIPFVRQHYVEIIPVLAWWSEQLTGKSKKKVQGKAEKKQSCLQLIKNLISSSSDDVKLSEQLGEVREEFRNRDEVLIRMSQMSSGEMKRLYKIKS